MNRILVCDDEKDIVSALTIYLSAEGFEVVPAHTGREALKILETEEIDLILMDVMMPEIDGLSATVKIRQTSNLPILLLTAKSEDTDKVLGLNLGADDYIAKPFNPIELIARVRSHLRRYKTLGGSLPAETTYVCGGIEADDREKRVTVDGCEVSLTPTEYEILLLLLRHPGQVFSPKEIYRRVWKGDPFGAEGTVAVHIRHLREKIEINPAEPRYIKVVWAQGYKMERGNRT